MKRNFKLLLVVVAVLTATYACTNKNKGNASETSSEFADEHNAQTSLDWVGTYSAILPCADCEGIETELTISNDENYSLTTNYLGVDTPVTETIEGKFVWLEDGNTIKLEGIEEGTHSPYFRIEENRVRYLDLEGNVVTSELENHYILTKEGNTLVEDKKWQLIELNGKEVKDSDSENYFIIFNSKDRRAQAKANCNVLLYSYKIKNELQIKLEQGMTTLMACPEGNIEDEYREVLNTVDNLSTDGETLTLNKARMAPLAKFKIVSE